VKEKAYCLGIESTADDFGVGVATFTGEILANVTDSYIPEQGGIHPREAARHHAEVAQKVLCRALDEAAISPAEVKVVAFSQGPGLGPCLRTGATVARTLAAYMKIPLVGVNHSVAHIEIGKLATKTKDPVTVYVSGGNTIVAAFDSGRYRVFGETLDIAVGNCIDVFAREAGLRREGGKPLGAILEEAAARGERLIALPYTVKGMDFSLSGLLTAAIAQLRKSECRVEDLCYSLQEHVFSMIAEVTERAIAHVEKHELLLTGGVASNMRLQTMLRAVAEEHGVKFKVVPKEYAMDNGAMIAWAGVLAYMSGIVTLIEESIVKPKWRVEEVDALWVR